MIELSALLEAVPGDAPCGPNLEYDPEFAELDKLATGTSEQQMGSAVIEAAEPEWLKVARKSVELLGRTKDLRVALRLVNALTRTEGFEGLESGTRLIRCFVEDFWDGVHPELDPDDDNDPTLRMNLLAELADERGLLAAVRTTPLVSVRVLGRFSQRDIAIATGELKPTNTSDTAPPTNATIEAAFQAVDLDELKATRAAVAGALDNVVEIERVVTERVGVSSSVNLSKARQLLGQLVGVLDKHLGRRGAADPVGDEAGEDEAAAGGEGEAGVVTEKRSAAGRLSGEISSREDVLRALDKLCAYYDRYEPGSPLPILLRRCRRLATMSFFEIIRDMAPDALAQVEALRGPEEENNT